MRYDCRHSTDEESCIDFYHDIYFPCYLYFDTLKFLMTKTHFPYFELYKCNKTECLPGYFLCSYLKFCIQTSLVCDGINHCLFNEDEINCGKTRNLNKKINYKNEFYRNEIGVSHARNLFLCRDEMKYLDLNYVCNGHVDCLHGSDELFCMNDTVINEKYCFAHLSFELVCDQKTKEFSPNDIPSYKLKPAKNFKKITLLRNFWILDTNLLNYYLTYINITNNIKANTENNIFKILNSCPNLVSLILKNNQMTIKNNEENKTFISNKLQFLDLSKNLIENINFFHSINCSILNYLDLSENPLKIIGKSMNRCKNLQILRLIKCKRILSLKFIDFKNFLNLNEISLNKTEIHMKSFIKFTITFQSIQNIFSKYSSICCLFSKFNKKGLCEPSVHVKYGNCSYLLNFVFVRIFFWIFGMFGIIGNFFSLIIFIKTVNGLTMSFRLLLILSDTMTSFYFLSIAIVSEYFKENYLNNDFEWRKSNFCKVLGFILEYSVIQSSLVLLCITIERYIAVAFPFSTYLLKRARIILAILVLVLSGILTTLPLISIQVA